MNHWQKSSYSGEGDGNECVEIANSLTHVSIRDSKSPTRATLTLTTPTFTTFLNALKTTPKTR